MSDILFYTQSGFAQEFQIGKRRYPIFKRTIITATDHSSVNFLECNNLLKSLVKTSMKISFAFFRSSADATSSPKLFRWYAFQPLVLVPLRKHHYLNFDQLGFASWCPWKIPRFHVYCHLDPYYLQS